MSDQIQGGMAEAMRLIQEGELAEATAVIQRALGGAPSPRESDPPPAVPASR
jgi:hypothetical protein